MNGIQKPLSYHVMRLKLVRDLKDHFCERMQKEFDATPGYNFIIVNAKVGSCNKGRDQTTV